MIPACVALFGGSFDPPHLGHVLSVSWALAVAEVDEVWIVPTWEHPFGKDHGAPFEARVAMCELAFAQFERARVSTIERTLGGVSHTLATIEALESSNPDTRFRLLIGADVLPDTPRWHRWEEVAAKAPPIVVGRDGYPSPGNRALAIPNVSSTDARASLRLGDPVDGWLPRAVVAYIETHSLYRSDS